jgi:hypothetical protein
MSTWRAEIFAGAGLALGAAAAAVGEGAAAASDAAAAGTGPGAEDAGVAIATELAAGAGVDEVVVAAEAGDAADAVVGASVVPPPHATRTREKKQACGSVMACLITSRREVRFRT